MNYKLTTSQQIKNPLKKNSTIQCLFKRLHQLRTKHPSKQDCTTTEAFCDYTQCKRKTTIYRSIFAALGVLFLLLAVLVLTSNLYIGFPFGPMPTAKHAVAFICTLLALPAFYLAFILNPFDELFKNQHKQGLQQLLAYWHSSEAVINKYVSDNEHERICELLRRKARREAEEDIHRIMKNTRRKYELLMQLEMNTQTRETKCIELLHYLEHEIDNALMLFKQHVDMCLKQLLTVSSTSVQKKIMIDK